jgi:hypothetical protein
MTAPQAKVRRDGQVIAIPASRRGRYPAVHSGDGEGSAQPGGKERLSNDQKILLVASTAKSEAVLKRRPNDV